MTDFNHIASYDYHLPENLIAQQPATERTASRLLIVNRDTHELTHKLFTDVTEYLHPGDCLVLNNTKVVPARLRGFRKKTGGKWEGLFIRQTRHGTWEVIGHAKGKIHTGDVITIPHRHQPVSHSPLEFEFTEKMDLGIWQVRVLNESPSLNLLDEYGELPLPPYISRDEISSNDLFRYQTVFAQTPGSVAAPTAGLHFTEVLLNKLQLKGVQICYVTLHVGIGTFRPVKVLNLTDHLMHEESCEISAETCNIINKTRTNGRKVFAVGTTVVRTLESAALNKDLQPFCGNTNLFIKPPFNFKVIDGMITNFHLPKSTLLVLVSTFAGLNTIKHAYESAVKEHYRFFSFGDAMLIH